MLLLKTSNGMKVQTELLVSSLVPCGHETVTGQTLTARQVQQDQPIVILTLGTKSSTPLDANPKGNSRVQRVNFEVLAPSPRLIALHPGSKPKASTTYQDLKKKKKRQTHSCAAGTDAVPVPPGPSANRLGSFGRQAAPASDANNSA